MNPTKIKIDALPCAKSSFKVWFWLMITCTVISFVLVMVKELSIISPSAGNILFPFLCIPECVFMYIFAKGCKYISETLYKCWLGIIILSFIDSIILALSETASESVINITTGVIVLIELVIIIKIIFLLVRNYTGLLGDLGKYLTYILVLATAIVIKLAIIVNYASSITPIKLIGPTVIISGFICYYIIKCLYVSYRLLSNGLSMSNHNDLTEPIKTGVNRPQVVYATNEEKRSSPLKKLYNIINYSKKNCNPNVIHKTFCGHFKIIWSIIWVIVIAGLAILITYSIRSVSHEYTIYKSQEEILKDASKNKDPELNLFYETEDIVGVVIDQHGRIEYFSLERYRDGEVVGNVKKAGEWSIIDGALEYYTGEGTSYITLIDGYLFYGTYNDGLCWNEDYNERTESLEAIGYAPTKSVGTKVKKFLWKEYAGQLWAHMAPESEVDKIFESKIETNPILYQGVYDITYNNGINNRFHARNISDNDSQTAWVIGEKEFKNFEKETEGHFPRLIFLRPIERIPIKRIRILNGLYGQQETWNDYGRAKDITIMGCYDDSNFGEKLYSGTLPDEIGWQTIEISEPAVYDYYSFIIDDYYPGKANNNIAISEMVFYP